MYHSDLCKVVPRQAFNTYCRILISVTLVDLSHIGCHWITSVWDNVSLWENLSADTLRNNQSALFTRKMTLYFLNNLKF